MDKRELGLTNAQIAELIYNLNDFDFLEVFMLFYEKANTELSIGTWIEACLKEIAGNEEI